jgi:predicted short-subunit dehydrogenase-like oxidoreductase (DUF2520 family)
MAQSLGKALQDCGITIAAVASRDFDHAQRAAAFIGGATPVRYGELSLLASHVIVAVSDRAIPVVAQEIAQGSGSVRVALHTCGAGGPELLAPLAALGVSCGAIHPLQTVRDRDKGVEALRAATYAVCGDGDALRWAEEIGAILSGRVINVPADARPLYHAAAVMTSNYLVALLDAAEQLMRLAGVPRVDALPSLAPLVRATLDNVFEFGAEAALTGPIVRGDAATVARHLNALRHASPSIVELYRSAGLHTLEVARQRGLGEIESREVEQALLRRE